MRKFKVLQVVEKITCSGFVVVPMSYDVDEMEKEVGEHLNVDDHFDDRESEVWDEWTVEIPDDVEVHEFQTVAFEDFVKKYRVKEESR